MPMLGCVRGGGVGRAAALLCLLMVLMGCGGSESPDDSGPSASSSGSASASSSEPASPSEEATPSVLEGGSTVEGPGFAFTVAPGYDETDNSGEMAASVIWSRSYSVDVVTAFGVIFNDGTRDSMTSSLMDSYFISRGADGGQRREDVEVMGNPASHWSARAEHVRFDSYVVNVNAGQSLKIDFERPPDSARHKRLQEAMLDSFRRTE